MDVDNTIKAYTAYNPIDDKQKYRINDKKIEGLQQTPQRSGEERRTNIWHVDRVCAPIERYTGVRGHLGSDAMKCLSHRFFFCFFFGDNLVYVARETDTHKHQLVNVF